MVDVDAVDTMNRPTYANPELARSLFDVYEFQVLAETTFGGIKHHHDIPDDEEWRVFEVFGNSSVEETVEEMEAVGVDYAFMDQSMQWSRRENRLLTTADIETLAAMAEESDGRIIPGVGYNPNRIRESLERIEVVVEEHGFKYVWFHPMTFGLRPTDQKCYPLYTKCIDLDIPVCIQTGQSAEPLPTEPGKPMYADEVAMDFPELTLVLTHAGWPWWREWCSMLWRHPNVYGNIGAFYPSFLPDEQIAFIDSGRIRDKVLWGTNGLGLERCKSEFLDLPISDKTKRRVLRENAFEVFDI
jgi:predicted TIM-barrel fold metal-dependent hydrolase